MKALRRGLELIVRPERAEALLWSRLRFEQRHDAREPLFNRYAEMARSIAMRVRPWGQPANLKDAEQWAYSGLLEAIDNYDPLRGAPFPAFARPRIRGSVRDGFARFGEAEAQISHRKRQERDRLNSLKRSGRAAEDDPVAALGELAACLAIGLMLDGTGIMGTEDSPDPGPSPYDSLAWRQTAALLEQEVRRLTSAEATVIRQHYTNGLTFAQIADMMALSRGRISQLHSAALAKLRKRLAREY